MFDAASNALLRTITVGGRPYGLAFSPNGRFTYVSSFFTNSVLVVNNQTKLVVATIGVGQNPAQLAMMPDGSKLFVANNGGPNVSVVNTATNAVIATIPVGQGPQSVAITPNGLRAYAANFDGGSVSVINTATNAVIATIPGIDHPYTAASTLDGAFVYVTSANGNVVAVIDTSTNTITKNIATGTRPAGLAFSPDGQRAYVGNVNSNSVTVIDTVTQLVISTIPLGAPPSGLIAITPDGLTAYVTLSDNNQVALINTGTNAVSTVGVGSFPLGVSILPNPPPTSVEPNVTTVIPGSAISALWTAEAGHSATDWIGLYRVGDPNTSFLQFQYTTSATSGTSPFTAPMQTGSYEFRLLENNTFVDTARSSPFTVSTAGFTVTAGATSATGGGPLSVSWTAPAGHPTTDWIGLYRVGDPNPMFLWFQYTISATSATFNLTAPTQAGSYQFRYLTVVNNRYTDVAQSATVTVAGSAYSVTAGATAVNAGAALSVSWTAPSGHSDVDWVGLFRVGDPNTAYGWWQYTGSGTSGTFNLTAPTQTGQYEFRYLLKNRFTEAARTATVTVN